MEIVVLNDYAFVNGGASQVALSTACALSRLGNRVTLFAPVGPVDPDLKQAPHLRVVCLGQPDLLTNPNPLRAAVAGLWNLRAAAALQELLIGMDPERTIVHVHGWTKALTSSVIRTAARAGCGVVLTLHDFFTACPNGAFFDFHRQGHCDRRPLGLACLRSRCDARHHAHKWWRVLRQVVQRNFGRVPVGLHDFIAISNHSSKLLVPFLPRGSRVYRLADPIDAQPGEAVEVERNSQFLAVGRLAPEKGSDLLASAAARAGVPLRFVGDGPLRSRIRSIYPATTITGWLSRAEVQAQFSSARALVLPSRCHETFGLAVLEAAARGVPAIVPTASAAAELIQPDLTGVCFQSQDVPDLERCLRRMLDPDLAKRLGRSAHREFWRDPPTLETHARRLLEIYGTVLAERSRSPRLESPST